MNVSSRLLKNFSAVILFKKGSLAGILWFELHGTTFFVKSKYFFAVRLLIHIEWLLTKWRKYVKNAPTIQIEKSYAANIPSPAVIVPFVRGKKFYEL